MTDVAFYSNNKIQKNSMIKGKEGCFLKIDACREVPKKVKSESVMGITNQT